MSMVNFFFSRNAHHVLGYLESKYVSDQGSVLLSREEFNQYSMCWVFLVAFCCAFLALLGIVEKKDRACFFSQIQEIKLDLPYNFISSYNMVS